MIGLLVVAALAGFEPADLRPLDRFIEGADVVALGEGRHTSEGFYQTKLQLIKYMVEVKGFRVVAFENPWLWSRKTADYVDGGRATEQEALTGLFGVWRSEAVRDLLSWLRRYNLEHPADPVRFIGFDMQQPVADVDQLRAAVPEAASCPVDAAAPREAYEHCLRVLREAKVERPNDKLSILSLTAWQRMTLLNRYENGEETFESWEVRDRAMAQLFLTLRPSKAKTIIWAANAHIAVTRMRAAVVPGRGRVRLNVNRMGTFLAAKLGRRYAPIGLIAYDVKTSWPSIRDQDRPGQNALETRLLSEGHVFALVDTETLEKDAIVEGYSFAIYDLRKDFRALVYLDNSPPGHMLP